MKLVRFALLSLSIGIVPIVACGSDEFASDSGTDGTTNPDTSIPPDGAQQDAPKQDTSIDVGLDVRYDVDGPKLDAGKDTGVGLEGGTGTTDSGGTINNDGGPKDGSLG